MNQCERCKEWQSSHMKDFAGKCLCKEFKVIDADGEEHDVWANDPWLAALKYAEDSNVNGEYYLMDNSVEITVNGKPYLISAEPDVHYSANPVVVKSADIMLEDE